MIDEGVGVRFGDARQKAIAHQRALAIATVGVEAVADDGFAVANDVGDDRNHRAGHFGKIDVGVGDGRGDGNGFFTDVDDAHGGLLLLFVLLFVAPR